MRFRLANLALALGLIVNMSGCCSFCEDGRFRLFNSQSSFGGGLFHRSSNNHMAADCECGTLSGSHMMEGPIMGPQFPPAPIPITTVPSNQPPQVFKIPQAPAVPYNP